MVAWRYEISLLVLKKIFHPFAALTHEIFFNTRREILYLRVAMKYPLFLNYLQDLFQNEFYRVRTLFSTKTSRTFQRLLRTHFPFFKDSIQCKKEPWVYVFFSSTTTWAILSWRSFILGTWESGLDRVSTEIQGLSSTTFNVRVNPGSSLLSTILKQVTNNMQIIFTWKVLSALGTLHL